MKGGSSKFLDEHTLGAVLDETLRKLQLPDLTFYQAGRHTFASLWVIHGGSMEKLAKILGHSTVLVTQRYAHLSPASLDAERSRIPVLLVPPSGTLEVQGRNGGSDDGPATD
jgi:integrase